MSDAIVEGVGEAKPITVDVLAGPRSRLRKESVIQGVFLVAGLVSAIISVLIVLSLVREAWVFATGAPLSEVFSFDTQTITGWFPRRGLYHVWTLILSLIHI